MPVPVAFLGGSLRYFSVDAQSETLRFVVIPGHTAGTNPESRDCFAKPITTRFPDVQLHI